jgi:hypothetical protein
VLAGESRRGPLGEQRLGRPRGLELVHGELQLPADRREPHRDGDERPGDRGDAAGGAEALEGEVRAGPGERGARVQVAAAQHVGDLGAQHVAHGAARRAGDGA